MSVEIRNLTSDDSFSLLEYDWSPLVSERDTIYLMLTLDHGRYCMVAEGDDGAPLGYLICARSADGKSVFVFHVHVLRKHRGQGIGSALMRRLDAVAIEDGVERIWLIAGDRLRWFYGNLGYSTSNDWPFPWVVEYIRNTKNASIMSKRLPSEGVACEICGKLGTNHASVDREDLFVGSVMICQECVMSNRHEKG